MWHKPERTKAIGLWFLIYIVFLACFRFYLRRIVGIYELLWACNSALILAAYGMFTLNRTVIATSISFVAMAHVLWVLDVLCYFAIGSFPFGSAKYIIWPTTTNLEIVMTLHHVWMIPACMLALHKNGTLDFKSFLYSCLGCGIVGVASGLLTPLTAPLQDGTIKYVNINMAHEMWKDIPFPVVHMFDPPKAPWIVYLCFALLGLNVVNSVCYLFLSIVFRQLSGVPEIQKERTA